MPNLPYQMGWASTIAPGVRAHTRTLYSLRLSTTRQAILATALGHARNAVTYTLARNRANTPAAFGGWAAGGAAAGGAPAGFGFGAVTYLNTFRLRFHVGDVTDNQLRVLMERFSDRLVVLEAGLRGALELVDIPVMMQHQRARPSGYVRRYGEEGRGQIHLDYARITAGQEWSVANTIVHEATHKFLHTIDHCYIWEANKIDASTPEQLLNNADSFATVITDTGQQQLV
ncbi:MAG: hypothetical protein HYX47_09515 [Burkholderiales bacterium]|nr:hypothetical protein [Burkholderiales bacterium]